MCASSSAVRTRTSQGAFRGIQGNNQRRGRVNLDYDARPDLTISVSSLYDNGYNDNHSPGFGAILRAQPGTDYLATDSLGRPILRLSPVHSPAGNGDTSPYYDNSGVSVDYYKSSRWLGNVSGRYFPAEWVTFEGTFAYDNRQRNSTAYAVKGYRTQSDVERHEQRQHLARHGRRRVVQRQPDGVVPQAAAQ